MGLDRQDFPLSLRLACMSQSKPGSPAGVLERERERIVGVCVC